MAKALIPLIIACGLACSPRPDCPPAELQTADGAEKALNDYYAAVSRDGLMAEFAYLDSSEAFFWVPPGYTAAIGFDSVASVIRRNANQWRHIEIRFDTVAVHLTGPHTATYSGRLHAVMTDTAGELTDIHLVETGTMIRRSDGWKLLCGQTSLIP